MRNDDALRASCERTREALEAYALDAVEPTERIEIAAHLERCPPCAAEAAGWLEVAALLGQAVPPAPLPPGLRERVLRAARAEARPLPRWRPARPPLSAVAAAVAVGALAWALSLQLQFNEQQSVVARLSVRSERYDRVLSVLRSADLRVHELRGTAAAPAAVGRLMIAPSSRSGMLVVWNLPPVPEDRGYQLWYVSDSGRFSGGVVQPDAKGSGYYFVNVPADLSGVHSVGLTEEPASGSDGPTGPRVLAGEL